MARFLISRGGPLGVAILVLAASGCGPERPLAGGMNVLLVTLDTTRVDYVSPFGGDPRNTPHLQALADRSAIFTRALSETNVTSPSHLTIMSGLRMVEHGLARNGDPVPDGVDTLAEAMGRAGYRTAGFPGVRHVSTHMGWRGFDVLEHVGDEMRATEVTDRALAWLRQPASAPFFAWVHYFDPHATYEPPADVAARFYDGDPTAGDGPLLGETDDVRRRRNAGRMARWLGDVRDPEYPRAMYAAEIHTADREFGRLLAGLEGLGLDDRTVVVVLADHGESLGEHGIFYGHQGIYEQQLRIPLIVHVPGLPASSSDAQVTTLDVAPSICQLTGVELRRPVSGLSLVPLLRGEESPEFAARRTLVHHQARHRALALRQDGFKLIWPRFRKEHPLLSSEPQLFDLRTDPQERVDLAAEQGERVRAMARTLGPVIELIEATSGDGAVLDDATRQHLQALGYLGD